MARFLFVDGALSEQPGAAPALHAEIIKSFPPQQERPLEYTCSRGLIRTRKTEAAFEKISAAKLKYNSFVHQWTSCCEGSSILVSLLVVCGVSNPSWDPIPSDAFVRPSPFELADGSPKAFLEHKKVFDALRMLAALYKKYPSF